MSKTQIRANSSQKKTYRLVKCRPNSHQQKPTQDKRKIQMRKEEKSRKNYTTFTTSHLPKSGKGKPKLAQRAKGIPRYHQTLQKSFPEDFNSSAMKRVKIKVKVKGDKETFYDYLDKNDIAQIALIMNERLPRRVKMKARGQKEAKEPNPASLKFPKVIKKLLKKEKKERQAHKRKEGKKSRKKIKLLQKQKMISMISGAFGCDHTAICEARAEEESD